MRILIISQCSAKKNYSLSLGEHCLSEEDFNDPDRLKAAINRLYPFRRKAIELYDGAMQKLLYPGIEGLRQCSENKEDVIDHYIISAGFGLVNENDELVPYNKTFQGKSDKFIQQESFRLKIPQRIEELVPRYDYVFFLVGEDYLCGIDFLLSCWNNKPEQAKKIILFTPKKTENNKNFHLIYAGVEQAQEFSYGIIGLKGYLFKAICDYLISNFSADCFDELKRIIDDDDFLAVLNHYKFNPDNMINVNRVRNTKAPTSKPQRKSLW